MTEDIPTTFTRRSVVAGLTLAANSLATLASPAKAHA